MLLRLAESLNQDLASDVPQVKAKVDPKQAYLEVKPRQMGPELKLWSLRKETRYFREAFGRELLAALA